jgi:hypothetical protein
MSDRAEYQKEWRFKNIEREKKRQASYYQQKKEEQRNRDLKSKYGITLEQYNVMYENQEGKCACCGIDESQLKEKYASHHSRFCVDHDHNTGKVRQLLCQKCNTLVGFLEKRKDTLGKALEYIEKHRETT